MKAMSSTRVGLVICMCWAGAFCLAQLPVSAVHPKGTFARPSDAIRNPELDKAWQEYTAEINDAVAAVQAVMDRKLKAATTTGDLPAVEAAQASRALFDEEGILPGDRAIQDDVIEAGNAFQRANTKLLDAYVAVTRALTQASKLRDANAAQDERGGLEAGLAFPPMPNVPQPLFDGENWIGWGGGWGEGEHEVVKSDNAVRLSALKFFAHQEVLDGDVTFELDLRNRTFEKGFENSTVQFGFQTNAGYCLVAIPAKVDGQILRNKGEVVHANHNPQPNNVFFRSAFDLPPGAPKWRKCRISRLGGTYRVVIDGKEVVTNQQLPPEVRQHYNLHIGVSGPGSADFRNLRITQNVGNQGGGK